MTAYMFAFSCASATFCFCRLSISCLAASLPLACRAARSFSRASSRSAVSSCTSRSSCLMVCCSWLSWSGAACARKSASPALQTATGAQAGPRGVRAAQAKAHAGCQPIGWAAVARAAVATSLRAAPPVSCCGVLEAAPSIAAAVIRSRSTIGRRRLMTDSPTTAAPAKGRRPG